MHIDDTSKIIDCIRALKVNSLVGGESFPSRVDGKEQSKLRGGVEESCGFWA